MAPVLQGLTKDLADEAVMSSISTIALSGLNAASRRLEVSAANVANVLTTGALPTSDGTLPAGAPRAYDPLAIVQTASAGGGTQTSITTLTPPTTAVSDPQAPYANPDGLVAAPNIDLAQEAVGQIITRYSFQANLLTLKTDDRLTQALLNITA